MSTYQQKQYELLREIEGKFKSGETPATVVEPTKNYLKDNRICLTSVVFIPKNIQKIITSKIIRPLKKADDRQYYYLPNSLHLTIKNVRTVHSPPRFTKEDIEKTKKIFKDVVPRHKSFAFELKGLFELPNNLSVSAYSGEDLRDLVLDLDDRLTEVGLVDDKIYASPDVFFGNINISRFATNPNVAFQKLIRRLKNISIGTVEIRNVSLITTNPVCHPDFTKVIAKYKLSSGKVQTSQPSVTIFRKL